MEKLLGPSGAVLVAAVLVSGWQANEGPTQCPVAARRISRPEGSSEIIMPNISSYRNSLLLCHKKHSSSSCEPIANIRNGALTLYRSAYFSVLECHLLVINASRFLIGEYQLSKQHRETCLQHFFLDVVALGSNRKRYGVIAAAIFLLALMVLFAVWWIQTRGRPAHSSTGVPD